MKKYISLAALVSAAAMSTTAYAEDINLSMANLATAAAVNTALKVNAPENSTVYEFYGDNAISSITDNSLQTAISSGSGYLTVAAWVYLDGSGDRALFSFGEQDDGVKFSFRDDESAQPQLQITAKGVLDYNGLGNVNNGEWTLVAWSLDLSKVGASKTFVGSSEAGTANVTNWNTPSSSYFGIGTGNASGDVRDGFKGLIANLTVFTSTGVADYATITSKVGESFSLGDTNLTWNGGTSGAWDYTTQNWKNTSAEATTYLNSQILPPSATFATAGASVTIDKDIGAKNITISENTTFDIAETGSLSTSALNISDEKNLTLSGNGSTTILEQVSGGGTLVVNGQTLYLNTGDRKFQSNLTINSGTLVNQTTADALNYDGSLTVTINDGELSLGATRWSVGGGNELVINGGVISGAGQGTNGALDFFAGNTVDVNGDATISAAMRFRDNGNVTFAVEKDKTLTASGTLYGDKNITKSKAGTLVLSSSASTFSGQFIIESGAVKIGSQGQASTGALGVQGNDQAANRYAAKVMGGATLDLNGHADNGYRIELAGGTLTNSGNLIGNSSRQTIGITVSDAHSKVTVQEGRDFALLASQYAATQLNLGENTLTKDGGGTFGLTATAITGDGGVLEVTGGAVSVRNGQADFSMGDGAMIKLNGGTLQALNTASGSNNTVTIGDVGVVLANTTTPILTASGGQFAAGTDAKLYLDISKVTLSGKEFDLEIVGKNAFTEDGFYSTILVGEWDSESNWTTSSEWEYTSFATDTGILTLTAIPEPSAFGLLAGLGALALVASRRRRK